MRLAPLIALGMLLTLGMLAFSGRALAGDAALADKHFKRGKTLMTEGKHAEACEAFGASMKEEPSGGAALGFGRCNELLGKTATAWREYRRAAELFGDKGDAERKKFANEQALALEPKLSKLTIRAPAGVTVTQNGEAAEIGTAVPVDPGKYTIEASRAGHETWSTSVVVEPNGDSEIVDVPALDALASAKPRPAAPVEDEGPNPFLVSGIVIGGVGAAVAIAGGILGGTVLGDASDAENDPALCPAKRCTPAGREAIEDAADKALAADVLIGVGAGVAATGIVLFVIGLLAEPEERAWLSPFGAGMRF